MSSGKFLETALRVVRENPEVFAALEEYDRTRHLRKIAHRQRFNITIDHSLLATFKRYCRERHLNMSRLLEGHIKEELGLKTSLRRK